MKAFRNSFKEFVPLILILFILLFSGLISCKDESKRTNNDLVVENVKEEYVVEIITETMDFRMSDTLKSGWITFHYKNQSPQTHFFLVEKYPEGKTLQDAKNSVIPHFSNGMRFINEGESEKAMAEFGKLPEWYGKVEFLGGSGLISPGKTAETMIKLKPGYYLMECYVKMSNGEFHTAMGMIRGFVVSDTESGNEKPNANIQIDISSTEGIVFNDSIHSGPQTFSVFFKDQIVHEHFVGHDVNLVKLDKNANLKELENWMNWSDPKGLIEPAPTGVTFLGGVNDMPTGSTGYFTAALAAGNYAFISEVPNASSKNMLKTFVVLE